MQDVTENGIVVETTLIIPADSAVGLPSVTWYRTRERCKAALSRQREAAEPARQQREQARARLIEKYQEAPGAHWWMYARSVSCYETYGPLDRMGDYAFFGRSYQMHDVLEGGIVVETTLTSPMPGGETWYRTKERCEAAHRQELLADESARRQPTQQLDKYR
jgi:hypothetical protein